MFQEFALFPHMDVGRNVAFGLKMKGMEPEASRQRVEEVLELVGLPGFGKRDVDELSGGERQRVALARSLAPEPELLMLDEPLGSLDRTLKERLMLELPQILRRTEQTALYVSHDQEEAFALADRIVVMRQGQVAQLGTPEAIYRQPNSAFVARFLGLDNLVQASAQGSRVDTPFGSMELSEPRHGEVTLLLRPEQASLSPLHGWQLEGEVVERSFRGGVQRVVLSMADGQQFSFDFSSAELLPPVGGNLTVYLPLPDGVQVLA
jgi:ABC-type Fe3+/spermidine/putrescine transport system ATPase subunit